MLRDPARTREKMSRPFVSVPNGYDHDGERLGGNWLSKIGSCGAIWRGKMAQKTQKPMISEPEDDPRRAQQQPEPLRSGRAGLGALRRVAGRGQVGGAQSALP